MDEKLRLASIIIEDKMKLFQLKTNIDPDRIEAMEKDIVNNRINAANGLT